MYVCQEEYREASRQIYGAIYDFKSARSSVNFFGYMEKTISLDFINFIVFKQT